MALLTTVIPVFNGEPYLRETLACLAAQTRRPDRVVILDNCSTDRTREIVESYTEIKCEWRQNDRNIGSAANLNRALGFSTETDYLHLLLSDDLVLPSFYEKVLSALANTPGRGLVFTDFDLIDPQGRKLTNNQKRTHPVPRRISLKHFLIAQSELRTVMCPAAVHKTNREPTPVTFRLDMPQVADCIFYAEWAIGSRAIFHLPEVLCLNRQHPASATSGNILNLKSWMLDEWIVMETVSKLIPGGRLRMRLHQEKLKCLFAARTKVKIEFVKKDHPTYAEKLRQAALTTVGPIRWSLGMAAVRLRDSIRKLNPP